MKNKQELIGLVQAKWQKKHYRGNRKGEYSYRLDVHIENKPVQIIEVYPDKVSKQVWKDIAQNKFIDKRYLFYCLNYMGNYHLLDWEELTDHDKN